MSRADRQQPGSTPRAPAYVVLVDGAFDVHTAKTASSLIRYRPQEVVAAVDRQHAGKRTEEVLGFGGSIPVVASFEEALEYRPNRLLIGVVGPGGQLPSGWHPILLRALEAGLDLYHGLHVPLSRDRELASLAGRRGVRIVDLRGVPDDLSMPSGERGRLGVPVVHTVGSDCNVGKMTAMLELERQAAARGRRYRFAATGQTGVLLAGRGIAVDAVVSDFVAGAAERLTVEAAEGAELVLVEGQGSLIHPYFSGVTLGLLHGSRPDGMILCHVAGRRALRYPEGCPIPPLSSLVAMYEEAASWLAASRVLAVALATQHLDEGAARDAIDEAAAECGLPVEDPVRFANGRILDACEALRGSLSRESYRGGG